MKKKTEIKKCFFCEKKAAKRAANPTGYMHCQGCGVLLCDDHTEYGYNDMPYCEECFFKQQKECEEECRGNMEESGCKFCDYC